MANSNINEKSRHILVEWMKEVCEETRREAEVFTLSVTILDKFLAKKNVSRQNWQLAGAVCLFLAAKLRDTYIFSTDELVEFTDHTYSAQQLIEGERTILTTLNFEIGGIVVAHNFLPYFQVQIMMSGKQGSCWGWAFWTMAWPKKKPSLLAAGSIAACSFPLQLQQRCASRPT